MAEVAAPERDYDVEPEEERDPFWVLLTAWALVAMGLVPRFAQYLHYRALSHDEAVLAHNVMERPLGELFGPFGDSMAPPGYLLLTRCVGVLTGINEYSMRAAPFVGGMLALLIFFPVARRLTTPGAALVALAFFAVGKHIIFFGDYVRPYSTDVLWLLLILAMALHMDRSKVSILQGSFYAVVGAGAVWMSFPAIFVLAGVAATQTVTSASSASLIRLGRYCLIYTVWAISFIALYLVSIAPISDDGGTMELMDDYYQYAHAFMPLPPKSFADLKWFNWNFIRVFENPGGLTLPGLGAFASVLGCMSLVARGPRRLGYLVMPIIIALLVSGFERYPFWGRTILYLAPILFMFMGLGIVMISGASRWRGMTAAVVCAVMLLGVPSFRAARLVLTPTSHHELNKALDFVKSRWRPDDLLYVHSGSSHAYRFSKGRYRFPEARVILEPRFPVDDQSHERFIANHLTRFRERGRVWVAVTYDHPSDVALFLKAMEKHARRVAESNALGSSAYLYDFGSGAADEQ